MVRVYFGLWAVWAAVVAAAFFTGNFVGYPAVMLGMAAFGLVFMGMMSVLPSTIVHAPKRMPAESGRRTAPDLVRNRKPAMPHFKGVAVPKTV
ncbi:MAG TPA: hypothetical protein PKD26_04210 [Pyrinomonadaceae bacterium]|nr:hypothetical protein [Pyrinomonadaceae bacterium]